LNTLRTTLIPAALVAAVIVPSVGLAQQTQPQPDAQVQPQSAAPLQAARVRRHRGFFMQALRSVGLSDQQKTQIQQLVAQYRQAHPRGSAPDRQARKELRTKIMAVLTPAQQAQLKTEMQQRESQSGRGRNSDRFPQPSPSPAT